MKIRVLIRLKPGILDAQGASVKRALEGLGFREVRDVRVGKVLDLDVDGESREETHQRVDEMCARLLVNPVIEDVTVEVAGAAGDGLLPEPSPKGRLEAQARKETPRAQ